MPFVTRHLHKVDYGRYVVVTSLMLIVAALTEGGIANSACASSRAPPMPSAASSYAT